MSQDDSEMRAFDALRQRGAEPAALLRFFEQLRDAGFRLADTQRDEMVCRWVPTTEQDVPPQADTIIRTLTRTTGAQSWSATFWLDGLRGPKF